VSNQPINPTLSPLTTITVTGKRKKRRRRGGEGTTTGCEGMAYKIKVVSFVKRFVLNSTRLMGGVLVLLDNIHH